MLSGGADSMALLDLVRAVDRRLGLGLELVGPARRLRHARRGLGARPAHRRRRLPRARRAAARRAPGAQARRRRVSGARPAASATTPRARSSARGEADVVVTAHNRDDQAETVLYRLAKYAAPSSLRAMRPREGGLVRPLLCLGAAELRAYCRELGIAYGDDETNADGRLPPQPAAPRGPARARDHQPARRRDAGRRGGAGRRRARRAGGGPRRSLGAGRPAASAGARRRPVVGARRDRAGRRAGGPAGAVPAAPRARRPGRRRARRPPAHAAPRAARRRHGRLAGGHAWAAATRRVREYELLAVRRAGGRARVPARGPRARARRPSSAAGAFAPSCIAGASFERDDRRGLARRRRGPSARSCCATRAAATACGPFGMARDVLLSDLFAGRPRAARPAAAAPWWPSWTVASPGCVRGAAPNGSG